MKVILLTGASSGIGLQAARMLAKQGHKVYGAARRTELIAQENNANIIPVKLDITVDESIQEAVQQVIAAEGRVDVLVNNAGYGSYGPIECVSMEEARRQMEVNVFGLARITQLVLPYMRQQGSGRIVNIASVAGHIATYFGGWYHVSKFAVEGFSDALRLECEPMGIQVCLVEPGAIKTDWGPIAADHLSEAVKDTAYEEKGNRVAAMMRFMYRRMPIAGPKVVAKAISKASNDEKPKARYHVGTGGWFLLVAHAILPARIYDRLVRFCMGR